MPHYKKRLKQRGFNQSIELARPAANTFNIPLDMQSVERERDTQSQTGLDRKQRRKNIRGDFDLVEPLSVQHVAIIDGFVTTTSTVNELACILKKRRSQASGCVGYCKGCLKAIDRGCVEVIENVMVECPLTPQWFCIDKVELKLF